MCGSIFGGRWSDHALRRLQAKNGGKSSPEVCLVELLISSKFQLTLSIPLSILTDEARKHKMGYAPPPAFQFGICLAVPRESARRRRVHCALLRWVPLHVHHNPLFHLSSYLTVLYSWIYSSTLAYIVDANTGRSSGAVACNSAARGIFGFAAAMLAENIQNKIGDGGLYSIWAGLLVLVGAMIMLLVWRGREWREKDAAKEERRRLAKEGK